MQLRPPLITIWELKINFIRPRKDLREVYGLKELYSQVPNTMICSWFNQLPNQRSMSFLVIQPVNGWQHEMYQHAVGYPATSYQGFTQHADFSRWRSLLSWQSFTLVGCWLLIRLSILLTDPTAAQTIRFEWPLSKDCWPMMGTSSKLLLIKWVSLGFISFALNKNI